MHDIEVIQSGTLVCIERTNIGTWNVEGLTDTKIIELQNIMEERDIGIMWLQEIYRLGTDYFITDEGYLVI